MVTEHNTQSFYSAPAVSIVMPVYNNRQYLNECIQSIEQQSFESFELICVDDGSTDGSLELLKQLIKYRENMRLLSQEHAGVSAARNAGIRDAVGTYLLFIDADDVINSRLLDIVVQRADSYTAEMTIFGFDELYGEMGIYVPREMCKERELYKRGFDLGNAECLAMALTTPNVWRILYRRSFLVDNNIHFHEDLEAAEDLAFIYESLFMARSIALVVQRLYHYRRDGKGSITHGERGDTCLRSLAHVRAFADGRGILNKPCYRRQLVNLVLDTIWYSLNTAHSREEFDLIYDGYQSIWHNYICDNEGLIDEHYLEGRYRRFFDATNEVDAEGYLFSLLTEKRDVIERFRAKDASLVQEREKLMRANQELQDRLVDDKKTVSSYFCKFLSAIRR